MRTRNTTGLTYISRGAFLHHQFETIKYGHTGDVYQDKITNRYFFYPDCENNEMGGYKVWKEWIKII